MPNRKFFICSVFFIALLGQITSSFAEYSASILQYHHVSSETPRVTSVTVEELDKHLKYLKKHHTVVPLAKVKDVFDGKGKLPENAVAITFDDGYLNILNNAHPLLREYNFPYTIFVNPAKIDRYPNQLTWQQMKKMAKEGVTFANHTLEHQHLLRRYEQENEEEWLTRVLEDIETSEKLLKKHLGYSLKWLAYPYGEFDLALTQALKKLGYWGFGQQSGAAAWYSNQQALPRFPASGRYASMDTLKTKLNSLALPVISLTPDDTKVDHGTLDYSIEIKVDAEDFNPSSLNCFFRGNTIAVEFSEAPDPMDYKHPLINDESNLYNFEFKLDYQFMPGRHRVNCTAPSIRNPGRFYWYSIPLFTATPEGLYLD